MNSVVVDTDVVSFLFKRDSRAELYKPHLTGKTLVISFMTVAELDRWPLERNWSPARRVAMEHQLRTYVVHAYDRELCRKWADVTYTANKNGASDSVCGCMGRRYRAAARDSPGYTQP